MMVWAALGSRPELSLQSGELVPITKRLPPLWEGLTERTTIVTRASPEKPVFL
jgi:hypothetical protein